MDVQQEQLDMHYNALKEGKQKTNLHRYPMI
jgi:hypothetical protein